MDTNNLYGLVLCGGNSSRMGMDKSRLKYHGIEQRFYLYQILNKFCRSTFMSCNVFQASSIDTGYEMIVDDNAYAGNGPVSGLLTAFQRFPLQDFLVVGCDYPYLNAIEIANFLESVQGDCQAAAFYNVESAFYEPVLAWYSHRSGVGLRQYFHEGKKSLQRFLQTHGAFKYLPGNVASLQSIDSYEKYLQVVNTLNPNANVAKS